MAIHTLFLPNHLWNYELPLQCKQTLAADQATVMHPSIICLYLASEEQTTA